MTPTEHMQHSDMAVERKRLQLRFDHRDGASHGVETVQQGTSVGGTEGPQMLLTGRAGRFRQVFKELELEASETHVPIR